MVYNNIIIYSNLIIIYNIFISSILYIWKFIFSGSLVRPKIVRSVHYCDATKAVTDRAYSDLTSYDAFPASAVYPTTVIYFLIKIKISKK